MNTVRDAGVAQW